MDFIPLCALAGDVGKRERGFFVCAPAGGGFSWLDRVSEK